MKSCTCRQICLQKKEEKNTDFIDKVFSECLLSFESIPQKSSPRVRGLFAEVRATMSKTMQISDNGIQVYATLQVWAKMIISFFNSTKCIYRISMQKFL